MSEADALLMGAGAFDFAAGAGAGVFDGAGAGVAAGAGADAAAGAVEVSVAFLRDRWLDFGAVSVEVEVADEAAGAVEVSVAFDFLDFRLDWVLVSVAVAGACANATVVVSPNAITAVPAINLK